MSDNYPMSTWAGDPSAPWNAEEPPDCPLACELREDGFEGCLLRHACDVYRAEMERRRACS